MNKSTVQDLLDVNQLLHKIKSVSHEPMKIISFSDHEEPQVYCWTDASSQNRHDGSSTNGIFIGMSGKKLKQGDVDRVSPWYWQSGEIDRVCRPPGAAEARAIVDGEDILFLLRFQWSEILGFVPDLHDIGNHVAEVGGGSPILGMFMTIWRSRILPPKGAERRVDLELLTLKESQNRTQLRMRWVNSQAMLANTLTKRGEDVQLSRFVQLGQTWRIVHDIHMFSGKRRVRNGMDVLE